MSRFDQRKQKVNTQFNISVQTDKPSIEELEGKGKQLLQAREYQLTITVFEQVLNLSPCSADAQYYISLALLNGQRPRLLTLSTIREIERRLQIATRHSPKSSHCFVLWAIVKEDYYVLNGLYDTPPTSSELLQRVSSISVTHFDEMIEHIQAPNNRVWEWLHTLS